MPGIIGLISDKKETILFNKMLEKLNHFDYQIEQFEQNGVHLGRIHLGYVNKSKQPYLSNDNRYAIVMIGEIFSYDNIESHQIQNDAEFILEHFIKDDFGYLPKINGQFSACIYDFFEKKLSLISDRFGTRPVYYAYYNNKFFFSPEVKSLILDKFNKNINYNAISDLFHFGHLFGYKTMFKDVHQLPEASVLIFQNGKIEIKRYWDYPYNEEVYKKVKFSKKEIYNYFEMMKEIMYNSMKRQTNKNRDKILFSLSGGLDSRWVIAVAKKMKIEPLIAFTMGEENSEDMIYATLVANSLNVNHIGFKIQPNDIWKNAILYSYISDYMSMINAPIQGFECLKYFFRKEEITITSQMCDAVFGSTLYRKRIKMLINNHWNDETQKIILNIFNLFNAKKICAVFSPDMFQRIKENYLETPQNYINNLLDKSPVYSYFNLLMNEHGRRGTLGGNILNNLFFETRMPSYDNQLIEFAYSIPIELRKNQYIYRETFNRVFPELASIPREGTNLPLNVSDLKLNLKIFENKIIGRLKPTPLNKIIKKLNRWNRPNYVSYKEWFKRELKQSVEDVILDNITLSRGIFNKTGVKKLLNEHYYSEKDNSKLIWQIINLEFFFRNFID